MRNWRTNWVWIVSSEDQLKLTEYLSGQAIIPNSRPLAQAYAGHQFGHFTMLGDGRAVLLGEILDANGDLWDVQLKGSGQTPYSRRGDGRGTLRSMVREYVMSESMHALGVPTSRSLAVCSTGDSIYREGLQKAGILTRVARSHIRVGTFEFARNYANESDMKRLFDYVLQRHFPELQDRDNHGLAFLEKVMDRQIDLIVNWMRVGFIHGVMNTDNTSIPGDTIDYGPCAFMNTYDPRTVYSSIDTQGRYAFGNQPAVGRWNLAILAGAILSFIDEDRSKAMSMAKEVLEQYAPRFEDRMYRMMCRKLGFKLESIDDRVLVDDLLQIMLKDGMDYTLTFATLTYTDRFLPHFNKSAEYISWKERWRARLATQEKEESLALRKVSNPFLIPRNHTIERILDHAENNNFKSVKEALNILANPYLEQAVDEDYLYSTSEFDQGYQTFCGT